MVEEIIEDISNSLLNNLFRVLRVLLGIFMISFDTMCFVRFKTMSKK